MYQEKTPPQSIGRWRITGRIKTGSPLHIGDGNRVLISERDCERKSLDGADPEYATVFTARDGRPVIPATSLKGALRAWAEAHHLDEQLIGEVFGNPSGGGAVTFQDAPLATALQPADTSVRFWCEGRLTGLSPQVVIDPATRTAEEGLLYYVEYVPEGAEFTVAITGHNATERQRSFLLHVLENAFGSDGRPARLGSQSANGWGKVSWSRTRLEALDVKAWLAAPPQPWHKGLKPVDAAAKAKWLAGMEEFQGKWDGWRVELRLTLEFDGAMLVNDPTRRKKADQNGKGAVGHAMIRKEDGTVYLPARSVRGAFRAQARRIWQTLAWDNPDQNVSETRNTNAPRKGDETRLGAFYKAFGATGWRAPVEFPDFRLAETANAEVRPQEFVAVDRFTGGAANERKFNAHGLWRPKFRGNVTIRGDRWKIAGAESWAWLLLAFTLRDWAEGDGVIGFGRSKGYGAFRARCEVLTAGPEADLLRGVLHHNAAILESAQVVEWGRSLESVARGKEAA
jgi:CRISPR/Cas system CSM-associated protein Csm3 (group 7 of RAMP superfamily)